MDQSFQYNTAGLTEEAVKQRFVPYLKDFYRHRYEPQADSFQVNLDNVSEGGLVADIVMTFRKSDGSTFVCACEATSRDKADEVKFRLNLAYFLWDAAAFGAFFAAVVYAIFYETQMRWLLDLRLAGNLGFIIGSFILGFFGWYFLLQRWKKYRYIYAVEQFKRYRADEQWIALADDVFPAPNDPYLTELKSQCIFNGFGLALVPAEGPVRALNAPSRLSVYGKNRKMVDWVTRMNWYQNMSQGMAGMGRFRPPDAVQNSWQQAKRWTQYLVTEPFQKYVWSIFGRPFGQTATVYNRFMSGQTVQKWVFVLCLLVIVPMCLDVLTYSEEDMADLEKLQNWHGGANPEDEPGYVLDGPAIPYDGKPTGVPKQYPVPKDAPEEDEFPTIDLSSDGDAAEEVPTIDLSSSREEKKPEKKPAPKPVASTAKSKNTVKPADDPCARWSAKKGWVLQDNAFTSKSLAAARVTTLKSGGVSADYAPRSCFDGGGSGYIVWVGALQPSQETARQAAAGLEKTLQKANLRKGKLLLKKLH